MRAAILMPASAHSDTDLLIRLQAGVAARTRARVLLGSEAHEALHSLEYVDFLLGLAYPEAALDHYIAAELTAPAGKPKVGIVDGSGAIYWGPPVGYKILDIGESARRADLPFAGYCHSVPLTP